MNISVTKISHAPISLENVIKMIPRNKWILSLKPELVLCNFFCFVYNHDKKEFGFGKSYNNIVLRFSIESLCFYNVVTSEFSFIIMKNKKDNFFIVMQTFCRTGDLMFKESCSSADVKSAEVITADEFLNELKKGGMFETKQFTGQIDCDKTYLEGDSIFISTNIPGAKAERLEIEISNTFFKISTGVFTRVIATDNNGNLYILYPEK